MRRTFDFSIVMAVYNAARWLGEAVDSVLGQDIGFREHAQLILVDDGSKDGSGALCDAYAERFPGNVLAVHPEHGGIARARNEGLRHAQGRWVSFMDSDDRLAPNALSAVKAFWDAHGDGTDVVSIPMRFFGSKEEGPHPLNGKFAGGSRVIDLEREYDKVQLSCASAFFSAEAAAGMRFDPRLAYGEDAKACLSALLGKRTLGVAADTVYCYRRGVPRLFDREAAWYTPVAEHFALDAIRMARERCGRVPRFVQYAILYVMQRRYRVTMGQAAAMLGEDGARDYACACFRALEDMEEEVLLSHAALPVGLKYMMLARKHPGEGLRLAAGQGDMAYRYGAWALGSLSGESMAAEFLEERHGALHLSGHVVLLHGVAGSVRVLLREDGGRRAASAGLSVRPVSSDYLGERAVDVLEFDLALPDAPKTGWTGLELCLEADGQIVPARNVRLGTFFPVSAKYRSAYAKAGNCLVRYADGKLFLARRTAWKTLGRECRFLWELLGQGEKGAREAVLYRTLFHAFRPFARKEIWLVSDRANKADDNGEAFFRYMRERQHGIAAYYILRRDSADWPSVAKGGHAVEYLGMRHKLLHLLASTWISSAASAYVSCPFFGCRDCYRDILHGKRQVFLQHGITKDDVSGWLNKYRKNLSVFVTSARPEYRSILSGGYFYGKDVVKLTGMPRYDRLEDRMQKKVTIMPTWRKYLARNISYSIDGIWSYDDSFRDTEYFKFYDALLNDGRLLGAAKVLGYTIQFMPHPNVICYIDWFRKHPDVEFCSIRTRYRDVFAESCMVVSDYSSVVFDFAYLRKPVLYCQFDHEKFFSGAHMYGSGYFDYQRDGFGEVEHSLEGIVGRIVEYMENGCKLKEKYRERIDNFFAFHDRNNCQRVYEAIKGMG